MSVFGANINKKISHHNNLKLVFTRTVLLYVAFVEKAQSIKNLPEPGLHIKWSPIPKTSGAKKNKF